MAFDASCGYNTRHVAFSAVIYANRSRYTYIPRMLSACLLAAGLALPASARNARPQPTAEDALYAQEKHRIATRLILEALDRYHYRDFRVDDRLSSKTMDNYLDILDGNRMFFLSTDIAGFTARHRYQLDDRLGMGQLEPAFEIFLIYRRRVQERITHARLLLQQAHDFSVNEQYRFDRDGLPWAGSVEALNEVWRKRVKNDLLSLKLAGKDPTEIVDTLQLRYQAIESAALQMDSDDVYQLFINAFTTAIEPHTTYLSPRSSENFDISMQLSLEGIGAVLRNANGEHTVIQRLVPGGPADLGGELQVEDRIVGVGQGKSGDIVDVVGWRLDDVVDLIRGPRNTTVRLEILPAALGINGATRVIEIVRDRIKLEQRAAFGYVIVNEGTDSHTGVISIPSFYVDFNAQAQGKKDYRSTTRDVRRILEELVADGISSLVVDLRGNGGGSLHEALSLTGLFIDTGPVVQTRDSNGRIEVSADPEPGIVYDGPLAVLVDRYSASASEIFSGAIQDYRRGLIIGEITFGKGTVQNIIDMNRFHRTRADLGKLKATIAQFFRINGGSNQYHGVEPDVIFPTARKTSNTANAPMTTPCPGAPWNPLITAAPMAPMNTMPKRSGTTGGVLLKTASSTNWSKTCASSAAAPTDRASHWWKPPGASNSKNRRPSRSVSAARSLTPGSGCARPARTPSALPRWT